MKKTIIQQQLSKIAEGIALKMYTETGFEPPPTEENKVLHILSTNGGRVTLRATNMADKHPEGVCFECDLFTGGDDLPPHSLYVSQSGVEIPDVVNEFCAKIVEWTKQRRHTDYADTLKRHRQTPDYEWQSRVWSDAGVAFMQEFIDAGYKPSGETALQEDMVSDLHVCATYSRQPDAMEFLLSLTDANYDVNKLDANGYTALHKALDPTVEKPHDKRFAIALLKAGADPDIKSGEWGDYKTARQCAEERGFGDIFTS